MGYEARDPSSTAQQRRRIERDAQLQQRAPRRERRDEQRQPISRVLVQTDFPTDRQHAGRKSVRRRARLWVKP